MGVRSAEVATDRVLFPVFLWLWMVVSGLLAASHPAFGVDLISAGNGGRAGNAASSGVATNRDGSVVAFFSDATNLVVGDTNQVRDVFVRDLPGNTVVTERVSVSSSGAQADRASHAGGGAPALSADGRIVAFYSDATNLVSGDTNNQSDVFLRLRNSNSTERISVAAGGTQGNGPSVFPDISADGKIVVFQSQASNLVANDTNNASDIFVVDRNAGSIERACGIQGNRFSFTPAISADGNVIAFSSAATNLVAGDTNAHLDIFVCDRSSGAVERVSVSANEVEGNGDSILPAISADGRFVAFKSLATNLVAGDNNGVVDVFLRDRVAGTTERISADLTGGDANDFSFPPSLSDDGRFVAFGSFATDLANGDVNSSSDVFVRDRQIGVTLFVDLNDQGELANRGTPDLPPAISGNGMRIAFVSFATNLSPQDTTDSADVYRASNPFFGPNNCVGGTCPSGLVCVDGFCVAPTASPTPTRTAPPTITGTPTRTATPTPTFRACTDDNQCAADERCLAGYCKKKRACDDNNPVVDRLQCFDREACIGKLCECGGDCNRDGVVLGSEITKAILILAGVRPLDTCATADINGDGQVFGNEITLAILNLDAGCVQEGRPLIFAHDRGDTVTLSITSATDTASQTADVSVGVSGGGGEVATVQLDLLYDPQTLDLASPGASCHKDPRLADQVIVATFPNDPPAPDGFKRLRLFVGSTSSPIGAFGDGPVLSCSFGVKTGASGMSTLGADRLNVGDARGNVFGTQVAGGGAVITFPTPPPAPTPAVPCAGDCNGDGQVLGNEITEALRILAGDLPLSECPAADADGDGEVFVTDVTRAVINLGLGCTH